MRHECDNAAYGGCASGKADDGTGGSSQTGWAHDGLPRNGPNASSSLMTGEGEGIRQRPDTSSAKCSVQSAKWNGEWGSVQWGEYAGGSRAPLRNLERPTGLRPLLAPLT